MYMSEMLNYVQAWRLLEDFAAEMPRRADAY